MDEGLWYLAALQLIIDTAMLVSLLKYLGV